ncbi:MULTISPECIES: hypothetical protein [Acetobacterales]|uniref:hypothetical protein n=1 Tax=Roseomonas TaxID=125216 RepID=UPI000D69A11B|nr:hypothetical protein [Pseudoroseomonas aestuarii]
MRRFALGAVPTRGNWNPKFPSKPPKGKAKGKIVSKEAGGEEPKEEEQDQPKARTQVPTYYPPAKGKRRYEHLRSYHHRDAAFLLDARHEVLGWTSTAEAIEVHWECKDFKFVPDFIVHEETRSYALTILHPLAKPDARRKKRLAAMRAACERQGLGFVHLNRDEVTEDVALPGAKDLFYYRYWQWPDSLPFSVSTVAERHAPATLGELHRLLDGLATWHQLLSMVANGFVVADISAGLGPDTPVLAWRTKGWRT